MSDVVLEVWVWFRVRTAGIVKDETGEGVISAAIAVLVMACLGALMWVGFKKIWGTAETNTGNQVAKIGS